MCCDRHPETPGTSLDAKILLPSGELDILCGVTMCSRLHVSLQEIKYNKSNTIPELRKLIVVEFQTADKNYNLCSLSDRQQKEVQNERRQRQRKKQ